MPLDPRIAKALDLDDYVNQSDVNGHERVSLYVGYYLTSKKVGAAPSPFEGNGTTPISLQTRRVSDRQNVFFHALSETERSG